MTLFLCGDRHIPSVQSNVSLTSGADGPTHTYTTDVRIKSVRFMSIVSF